MLPANLWFFFLDATGTPVQPPLVVLTVTVIAIDREPALACGAAMHLGS